MSAAGLRSRWRGRALASRARAAGFTLAPLVALLLTIHGRDKLSREFMRPALKRAKVEKPFRPWHDLRHTALTHEAAAGNPAAYVQMRAGHSQGSITERYIHASQVLFPGAAERARIGSSRTLPGSEVPIPVPTSRSSFPRNDERPLSAGVFLLPGLDSNQQPSG